MKQLIKAKWIYPVTSSAIKMAMMVVGNGKIISLGEQWRTPSGNFDEIIELPDHIVMPGFINAHTHLELSCLRKKIPKQLPFIEWIKEVKKRSIESSKDFQIKGIKAGLDALIQSGVTTIADISTNRLSIDIMKQKGVRGVVFHEVIGFLSKFSQDNFNRAEKKVKEFRGTDLIGQGVSPHSPYSVSPELIKEVCFLARKENIPRCMHIGETRQEVDFIETGTGPFKDLLTRLDKWDPFFKVPGCSAVSYLKKLNILQDIISVHSHYIKDDDISLLKRYNASVVFCPLSKRWFGRTDPYPLGAYLNAKINVSLGTDSLASNESLSLLSEMRQVKEEFNNVSSREIIKMATINGAKALKLDHLTGDLTCGKEADLIAIPAKNVESKEELEDHIIEFDSVDLVMVKGKTIKT